MKKKDADEKETRNFDDFQNVFRNKNGDYSRYALACGYVQREEDYGLYRELYMEHEHFHVRFGVIGEHYKIWETFANYELTKARKRYRELNLYNYQVKKGGNLK